MYLTIITYPQDFHQLIHALAQICQIFLHQDVLKFAACSLYHCFYILDKTLELETITKKIGNNSISNMNNYQLLSYISKRGTYLSIIQYPLQTSKLIGENSISCKYDCIMHNVGTIIKTLNFVDKFQGDQTVAPRVPNNF